MNWSDHHEICTIYHLNSVKAKKNNVYTYKKACRSDRIVWFVDFSNRPTLYNCFAVFTMLWNNLFFPNFWKKTHSHAHTAQIRVWCVMTTTSNKRNARRRYIGHFYIRKKSHTYTRRNGHTHWTGIDSLCNVGIE